jgi:hypothetical protein
MPPGAVPVHTSPRIVSKKASSSGQRLRVTPTRGWLQRVMVAWVEG